MFEFNRSVHTFGILRAPALHVNGCFISGYCGTAIEGKGLNWTSAINHLHIIQYSHDHCLLFLPFHSCCVVAYLLNILLSLKVSNSSLGNNDNNVISSPKTLSSVFISRVENINRSRLAKTLRTVLGDLMLINLFFFTSKFMQFWECLVEEILLKQG